MPTLTVVDLVKVFFLIPFFWISSVCAAEISFTMDDPTIKQTPLYSAADRNQKILAAFDRFKIKGALFVCGTRIDNEEGKALVKAWDKKGHIIANHSYSHLYYPSEKISLEQYRNDFLKVEPLIETMKNFTKLYRFPFLKEGDTQEKRDGMREFLKYKNYKNGYVSIDASDWYVDERLSAKLSENPEADLKPYRDFYLEHMLDRATYYNELSKKVFGREIKHTVLVHHSLLNALFLGDLMQMFKNQGWKLISAKEAFKDPAYNAQPNTLPAGESLIWATAKQTGKFEDELRYPAEDSVYEKPEMDLLKL